MYSWLHNHYGQLGRDKELHGIIKPVQIVFPDDQHAKIIQVICNKNSVMVSLENDHVYIWRQNKNLMLGQNNIINHSMKFEIISTYTIFNQIYPGQHQWFYRYFLESSKFVKHDDEIHNNLDFLKNLFSLDIKDMRIYSDHLYFLTNHGGLFVAEDTGLTSKLILKSIESDVKFVAIEQIGEDIVVLSNTGCVYELSESELTQTWLKSIEQYSIVQYEITYKTFAS